MMNHWRVPALLAAIGLFIAACGPLAPIDAETVEAALAGENEVPAVATMASGEVSATLTGLTLTVQGGFEGLMGDLIEIAGSSAHIHEAAAGANGGVVFALEVDSADQRSGTLSGEFVLTPEQRETFRDGDYYVNIHTELNPTGELRAQLVDGAPTFAVAELLFDATLLPDNEVPPVVTAASGSATATSSGFSFSLEGSFEGLESDLLDVGGGLVPAHIHVAPAGENGPVAFAIAVVSADERMGTLTLTDVELNEQQRADFVAGRFYVNVHTEEYAGGEIRGQLEPF